MKHIYIILLIITNLAYSQTKIPKRSIPTIEEDMLSESVANKLNSAGNAGPAGADGVVDGIRLDGSFKLVLEHQKGYKSKNYFNKDNIVLGVIPNNTDSTINPSTTNHVSDKIYLNAGSYSLYNVSSQIYGYIQIYLEDGTYVRTERYFSNDLYFNWVMQEDGYIIMDVDNRVTTPIDQIMISDYDLSFNLQSNIEMYGTYSNYEPYNEIFNPNIIYEKTENLNDALKWIKAPSTNTYNTDWYIDIETNGSRFLSVFDEWATGQFNTTQNPQIIEFNSSDVVINTQTASGNFIGQIDGAKWKRWELNTNTVKVRFAIPNGNANRYGVLTRESIQNNFRINLGAYFTKEQKPYRVKSINDAKIDYKDGHKLKGKTIALFGDSITDEDGTIGSRSSISIPWLRELELTVFNYAEGSAGLTDWNDTNVVTDGTPTTVSHDNVVSNQIEEMIFNNVVPDIVILTGGTNDAFRGRLKGNLQTAISDYNTPNNQDKETYYGMFFWAVKRLRDYNPNVQIFLYKPIKGIPEGDFTAINTNLINVWDSYDEVAPVLGCLIIDCKDLLSVIVTSDTNPYYEDALHPSNLAKDKVLAPFILDHLTKASL